MFILIFVSFLSLLCEARVSTSKYSDFDIDVHKDYAIHEWFTPPRSEVVKNTKERQPLRSKEDIIIDPPLGFQPNFVFILTDDQDTRLGRENRYTALGSVEVMESTLEHLAKEGASFPNFFVNTPICCPSRTETFSGRYFHNVGPPNDKNGTCMHADTSLAAGNGTGMFGLLKTELGYNVGIFGKTTNDQSVLLNQLISSGSVSRIDSPLDYNNYDGLTYLQYWEENGTTLTETLDTHDPEFKVLYQTTQIGNRTLRWLDDAIEDVRESGKPFFAFVGPHAPHYPAQPAPWYEDIFPELQAPVTPNYNGSNAGKAQHVAQNPALTERVLII